MRQFAAAVVGLLLIWGAAQLGLLNGIDGWLYDRLLRASWLAPTSPPPVLLIEQDSRSEDASPEDWLQLVAQLRAQDVRVIGLIDPPKETVEAALTTREMGRQQALLIVAGSLIPTGGSAHNTSEGYRWLSPPLASTVAAIAPELRPLSGIAPPRLDSGIARTAPVAYRLEQDRIASLPAAMAAAIAPKSQLPESRFGVDFSRLASYLPRVDFERARTGGLLDEMIAEKAVIVTRTNPAAVGVATPAGGEPISAAHFHALALQSLISDRWIKTMALGVVIAIMVGAALLCWMLFSLVSARTGFWLLLTLLLVFLLTAWLLLTAAQLWLPVSAPLLATLWIYALTLRQRLKLQGQRVRQLVLEGATQLDQHQLPQEFLASDEHWSQIAALVSQLLEIKRTIFLARIPGAHRLQEVKALHCSFDEIEEKRRDYQRTPYSTAIEESGPIRLGERFLRPRAGEESYLVPLMLGSEVLGFWAFSLASLTEQQRKRLIKAADILSRELAELLDQRERLQQQTQRQQQLWRRLLRTERGRATSDVLETTMERLGRRLAVMESVLNGMESAAILYDLFGRVIQVNRRMADNLNAQGLAAYNLTVADLLAQLLGVPLEQAQAQLRTLILEQQVLSQTVRLANNDSTYLLRARPLTALDDDSSQPFELLGILLELIDLREAQEVFTLKEDLITYLGAQYRDALGVVKLASGLLANPKIDVQRRDSVMQAMNGKLNEIVAFSQSVERFLGRDLAAVPTDQFPISPLKLVESAIEALEPRYRSRGIQVQTKFPRVIGMVRGSPQPLARCLRALLSVMIDDCSDDGELRLEMTARNGRMLLTIENTGFGLPNERLQAYLDGDEELTSADMRALRDARAVIAQWDARLSLQSEVGDGMRAELELQLFR